jgi:HSP20 family molecular chaperone IbpA
MTRVSVFSSPLMLGFDEIERLVERAAKTSPEGYPPYNIERMPKGNGPELFRITLAVAGFARANLEIAVEDNQLTIKGRIPEEASRDYLHRGIAGRQFQRTFVLADGVDVVDASLGDGLLTINLERPEPKTVVRRIEIKG